MTGTATAPAVPKRRGRPPIDLTGREFADGQLTVVRFAGRNDGGRRQWLCQCKCGNKKVVVGAYLVQGRTRSCGCIAREASRTSLAAARARRAQTGDWRDAVKANLASLNEIIAELTAVVAEDPEFAELVRTTLRNHSWSLGFEFQGERAPADWTHPQLTRETP
jgi:hypothetical protein